MLKFIKDKKIDMSSPKSKKTINLSKSSLGKKKIKKSKIVKKSETTKKSLASSKNKFASLEFKSKTLTKYEHPKDIDYVFTDGSTFNNVRKSLFSKGGIGVFYGDNDKRNLSEPFYLKPVTNNRCELYACIKAIENYAGSVDLTKRKRNLNIYSDSTYVINSVTKWINNWKYNGWKTSKGKDVENKDLIVWIDKLLQTYCSTISIRFIHVKAHKSEPKNKDSIEHFYWYGNKMADKLAVYGSIQSVGGNKV